MEFLAEIEFVKENGSITNVTATGMTAVSGSTYGYTSNTPSSDIGEITSSLTITKSNNKVFKILFSGNAYPIEYYISGVKYINGKKELIIFSDSNSLTINFTMLNKPNSNYTISTINTNIKVEYDKKNVMSYVRGNQLKNDDTMPSYSAISQVGKLEILDTDNLLLNLSLKRLLNEDSIDTTFYIVDGNNKQKIAHYDICNHIDYSYGTKSCSFDLTDEIANYNQIIIEPIPLNLNTFTNLYNLLKSYTPNNTEFQLSTDASTRFASITSYYYSKESSNLFDLWNWFCEATKTTLYINENGKKVFKVWL